jgi:hypothetical protein
MPAFQLEISPGNRYILMTVNGDYTSDLALAYNIAAHALGRRHGIRHYLVDLTGSHNVESTIDKYDFAYHEMQNQRIDRSARVAILVAPEDHSHDFIEVVTRNNGLDITLFRDRLAAEQHLLAQPDY